MKSILTILLLFFSLIGFSQGLNHSLISGKYKKFSLVVQNQQPEEQGEQQTFGSGADFIIYSGASGLDNDTITREQFNNNTVGITSGSTIGLIANDTIMGTLVPPVSNLSIYAVGTGAKPVIIGSEKITGWTVHSSNVYKATFNTDVEQLFVDGERMKLARYPNSGYFLITTENTSDIEFTSTDLDGGIDYTGASFLCRVRPWNIYSETVAGSSSQTITLDATMYSLGANEGFWLSNKLAFLDQAGEWFYDTSTNTVYLWTENGDSPANYEVRGSTKAIGIDINSKDNIEIDNIEISHFYTSGIDLNNSDYTTIDSCKISFAEQWGIYAPDNGCNNTTISNTEVSGANRTGILVYGANSIFTNNVISDIALQQNFHKTAGDWLGNAIYSSGDDCILKYNDMRNMAYSGIHFRGERDSILYNYIENSMAVLGDGGAIYTYNGTGIHVNISSGSVVNYNIVNGFQGNRDGYPEYDWDNGYGIYMDDFAHDIDIHYNTVHNGNCGIYLHNNSAIDVRYNDISDCNTMILGMGEEGNSYFYYNTLYAYDEIDDFIWWQDDPQRFVKEDGFSPVYDNNTYINRYNSTDIFNNTQEWASWQADGNDANSTFDNAALSSGDAPKFLYNATSVAKDTTLTGTWKHAVTGATINFPYTIQPYTSIIFEGQ